MNIDMNIHYQVARSDKERERKSIVESNKVKEGSLKVAPGKKCWRKIFLQTIKITGELLFLFC